MTPMPQRYKSQIAFPKVRLFKALKDCWKEGYSFTNFKSDFLSGLVVSLVAVPLGMALAIASGVPPQYGLYTVIVGGGLVALLGGSRFQVTGPTAAFVVILYPVVQKFGFAGLLVAGGLAGLMMIVMGLAGLGRLIQFIPYPVTTGFTSGIAVVIGTLQVKDFFGLAIEKMPEGFGEKLLTLFEARHSWSPSEFTVGLVTLSLLIIWPKVNKKIPAPLVALTVSTVGLVAIQSWFPEFQVSTLGSRFSFQLGGETGHGIPPIPPLFQWPWEFESSSGHEFIFNLSTIKALLPSAFAIAMLGAIESLLSAVVADGMTQSKHDPDAELIALGIGNVVCPFFGGIPATGAIARTATNIRFGARSPLSAFMHALFTLLIILVFSQAVSYLPMSALAALLLIVAYNMSEAKHFFHILKVAPRSDLIVLLSCFLLTVMFDMVVGVTAGVLLAALLFMKRMAEISGGQKLTQSHLSPEVNEDLPHSTVVYEINGPLFFGAAGKAAGALTEINDNVLQVLFLMRHVPVMDVTGMIALESAVNKVRNGTRKVALIGLQRQPLELIKKSNVITESDDLYIFNTVQEALAKLK